MTYTASAYCSEKETKLPPAIVSKENVCAGLLTRPMAFGEYAGLEPFREVLGQLWFDSLDSKKDKARNLTIDNLPVSEIRWRFQRPSSFSRLLSVLSKISQPFIAVVWGYGIVSSLPDHLLIEKFETLRLLVECFFIAGLFVHASAWCAESKPGIHKFHIPGLAIFGGLTLFNFGSLIGGHEIHFLFWLSCLTMLLSNFTLPAILALYSKFSQHDGSEFNRTDGMVRFKRRFRPLFVAPFDEFDPVLQALPQSAGGADYTIWLHHRYSKAKVCLLLNLHSPGLDRANALALWDCLQRYMDVTQPLPDLPVLEQSRHLDPVTVEHDRRTGRDSHYWRNKDADEWYRNDYPVLMQRLKDHPWQQHPCTVRARIDPALSIEAYYRRQEALGIRASVKSGDFVGALG